MKSLHYLWLFGLAGLACGSEPQSTYEDVNLYKGSVRVVWVDVLDAKGSHQEVWFEEDGGDSYELAFDEGIPYVLNSGDHVEFEGVLEDSGVLVPWVETFHHEAFLPNLRRAALGLQIRGPCLCSSGSEWKRKYASRGCVGRSRCVRVLG